ncbi:MAG: septal ring lytic transglycosylase RlpA family protein [Spirosomaceae bacterium]|nr:septal ring lytic transglycosylase RlpA family protein [Spirosomataceae bacterium]
MKYPIYCIFGFLFLLVSLPTSAQLLGREEQGKASFYAQMFNGRKTSCGEKFSQTELTAAHRTLPFNTMVEVTNLSNNKSVIVRINDRGPYHHSRMLDLTRAAAQHLGFLAKGVATIKMRIVGMEGMVLLGKDEFVTDTGEILEKVLK